MNLLEQFRAAIADNDDATAEAVSQQLEPRWTAALCDATQSPDVDMRWWAVRALAICGERAAVDAVVSQLSDADAGVRAAACRALAELHKRFPAEVAPHLPALAEMLADEDGLVRQSAADALALCGDAAVPVLESVLAGQHEGARTRAAQALGRIATLRAAPALYRHLDDPNHLVRMYAYTALEEMGLLENVLLSV